MKRKASEDLRGHGKKPGAALPERLEPEYSLQTPRFVWGRGIEITNTRQPGKRPSGDSSAAMPPRVFRTGVVTYIGEFRKRLFFPDPPFSEG